METIFKLEAVCVDFEIEEWWIADNILQKELNVKEYIDKISDEWKELHHINVFELPINQSYEEGDFISEKVYLPDGSLYIQRDYSTLESDCFKGRDDSEVPLKIGDKVMRFNSNGDIVLGVVYKLPPNKEGGYGWMDEFDDSYTILSDFDEIPEKLTEEDYTKYHTHVSVDCVFPLT